MTKRELIEALAGYEDDEVLYAEYSGSYNPSGIAIDGISCVREEAEAKKQRRLNRTEERLLGSNLTIALARAKIKEAEEKLAKRETKKWRGILTKQTKILNDEMRSAEYYGKELEDFTAMTWQDFYTNGWY